MGITELENLDFIELFSDEFLDLVLSDDNYKEISLNSIDVE